MDPTHQEKVLTQALRFLHKLDHETVPAALTPAERSSLLAQLGYIQIAVDHWRACVVGAPRVPWTLQQIASVRTAAQTIAEALT